VRATTSLLVAITLSSIASAQRPANGIKLEPTRQECHSAFEQSNSLAAAQGAWLAGGAKGTSPLSHYSIPELDATADLLSHCSVVEAPPASDGSVHINSSFIDLMRLFQSESNDRVLRYVFRHHLWDDVVKEDGAGMGRE
jgi:hypothetical protein